METIIEDKRSNKHFGKDKKTHTLIKHSMLSKTLEKSLSIANMMIRKNQNYGKIYTYIDLFAGRGCFDDGTDGSPLIAFNLIKDHLNSTDNFFDEIRLIAVEKNEQNAENLGNILATNDKNANLGSKFKYGIGKGDWESFDTNIKGFLQQSQWGFIFADPFSTELDINKLIDTIKKYKSCKDIMVFFNFNTLCRQDGRKHTSDIQRICKALGLNEQDFLKEEDFSEKFQSAIQDNFSSIKELVVGAAYPIEVKDKLITADYFYLV